MFPSYWVIFLSNWVMFSVQVMCMLNDLVMFNEEGFFPPCLHGLCCLGTWLCY